MAFASVFPLQPVAGGGRLTDATTAQRYEIKFWATEEQAAAMLRIARNHLEVDPFCREGPERNVSLYLDSPGRTFFDMHLSGVPARVKLRVRTYGDPNGPAFLEVKRRVKTVTSKHRTAVSQAIARQVVAGRLEATDALAPSPDLTEFLYLYQRHMVEPAVLVAARRLALRSTNDDGSFRMTLDRDLQCQRPQGTDLRGRPGAWSPVDLTVRTSNDELRVLIETKFVDAAPGWLAPALELLGLHPASYSKYVAAMSQESADTNGWNPPQGHFSDEDEGD